MNRMDLTAILALNAIADDYEHLEAISQDVRRLGERCGLVFGDAEIKAAVLYLLEVGFAKAYRLSPYGPIHEIAGVPSLAEIGSLYFFRTEIGSELQLRPLEGWPFEENGSLRQGWHLSETETFLPQKRGS